MWKKIRRLDSDISLKEAVQGSTEDNKEKTLDQELTGDFYLQVINSHLP